MDREDDEEDKELNLQRESTDLVNKFLQSLPLFLRKSTGNVRRHVGEVKTEQLINLLEPFQEDPQLLERHLKRIVEPLVEAFLEFLATYASEYHWIADNASSQTLIPLPRAICKILYSLCKIRGYKAISRHWSNTDKPQHLERMIYAFESWSNRVDLEKSDGKDVNGGMVWEERYVLLLWLWHLLLAPFDLASLSSTSVTFGSQQQPVVTLLSSLELPDGCPSIATRLIVVSCRYLGVASKEREASVKLLVRLALRQDMQKIDLHRKILKWTLDQLTVRNDSTKIISDYALLGLLSFLADFTSSADSAFLNSFSDEILQVAQQVGAIQNSSAVATKLMIKLYREIALHCIKSLRVELNVLTIAIGYLMDQIGARDTVVRFAASKALARIASQLNQDMALQVVEVILTDLEKDVIYLNSDFVDESLLESFTSSRACYRPRSYDLISVNALRWHGLILTLSHLIFQRSIPASNLQGPIQNLIKGINFTQRNALGSSVGANVRDAACFGLWALAKKFSTVDISNASDAEKLPLQALANELVVAALLDPASNIRRAASAALQEMVGRHPNTIDCGKKLELIQIVDFHTVASRKNAMKVAATKITKICPVYWDSLLLGLLSWRCIRFEDVGSRQKFAAEIREYAAIMIGSFAVQAPASMTHQSTMDALRYELRRTKASQVAEQHGLLWALTSVLINMEDEGHKVFLAHHLNAKEVSEAQLPERKLAPLWRTLDLDVYRSSDQAIKEKTKGHPHQLVLQASAALICQLCKSSQCKEPEHYLGRMPLPSAEELEVSLRKLSDSMTRQDSIGAILNAEAIAKAFAISLSIAPNNPNRAHNFASHCFADLSRAKGVHRFGILAALTAVIFLVGTSNPEDFSQGYGSLVQVQNDIIDVLVQETNNVNLIELRTFSITQMSNGFVKMGLCTPAMLEAFEKCLNDYTIDQRKGDVGSLVRMAAVNAVGMAIRMSHIRGFKRQPDLIAKICGLAVEKLDRVRHCAITFLVGNWADCGLALQEKPKVSNMSDATSVVYFERMLSLSKLGWTRLAILEGFVTTAGGEYEFQINASRTALVNYTSSLSQSDLLYFFGFLVRILQYDPKNDQLSPGIPASDIDRPAENDRVVIPAMEVISFFFEAGITVRLDQEGYNWLDLYDLVTKRKYKSTNLRKLEVVTRIYYGLAQIEKAEPQRKALLELCGMLKHRYPLLRNAAADALLLATGPSPDLIGVNWMLPTKENAPHVASIRARLGFGPAGAQT